MELPKVSYRGKEFFYDKRLSELRPVIVDLNWSNIRMNHNQVDYMDYWLTEKPLNQEAIEEVIEEVLDDNNLLDNVVEI